MPFRCVRPTFLGGVGLSETGIEAGGLCTTQQELHKWEPIAHVPTSVPLLMLYPLYRLSSPPSLSLEEIGRGFCKPDSSHPLLLPKRWLLPLFRPLHGMVPVTHFLPTDSEVCHLFVLLPRKPPGNRGQMSLFTLLPLPCTLVSVSRVLRAFGQS